MYIFNIISGLQKSILAVRLVFSVIKSNKVLDKLLKGDTQTSAAVFEDLRMRLNYRTHL